MERSERGGDDRAAGLLAALHFCQVHKLTSGLRFTLDILLDEVPVCVFGVAVHMLYSIYLHTHTLYTHCCRQCVCVFGSFVCTFVSVCGCVCAEWQNTLSPQLVAGGAGSIEGTCANEDALLCW